MKTYLYMGSYKLLEKSGIGRAIMHQKSVLTSQGVEVVDKLTPDTDTIHINTTLPNSVAMALWAKLNGVKVVYYGHSTMEDFRNSFVGSNLMAPLFKQWIMFCYNLGDVVITPTAYSKDILNGYGLRREVHALSNGIDTDFFEGSESRGKAFRKRYDLSDEAKVVISVGHFIERKGILDFAEAARQNPDVTFLWFGHTNLNIVPTAVRKVVENPPENLTFAGYVSKEELRDAYCGADLFAFMSHEETEGIVVLEALACGIPTVVRDIPVYDGWLEDGVNIHKAVDNADFTDKIRGLLSGETKDLTEEGKAVADSRSIHAVGKDLMGIYSTIPKRKKLTAGI